MLQLANTYIDMEGDWIALALLVMVLFAITAVFMLTAGVVYLCYLCSHKIKQISSRTDSVSVTTTRAGTRTAKYTRTIRFRRND